MTLAAVKTKKSRSRIGWNNRSQPFGEKLYQAIEYLSFRAKNSNAIAACETLGKIVSEQQKYRLFQKFFPKEWANSRSSLFKTGYYEEYSERTNEFFELVNKNLFPFLEGWCYDPEMELENFYIFSPNLDLCCEDFEYENLRVSYVAGLLFYLDGEEIWNYLACLYGLNKNDFPEIKSRPDENLWHLEKTGKIELYLNLFELIDHSTGNPWLDTVNCRGGCWYEWDEQTINFLAESHKDALDILEKTSLLDGLIEANPKDVLLDLISLWNEGRLPEREN